MMSTGDNTPGWVRSILRWKPTWVLSRIVLTSAFWIGALDKLIHFQDAIAEQAHWGLKPPALFAGMTIAVELIGSWLVIRGRLVWLGAGMLGVFTLLATLIAHAFWTLHGDALMQTFNTFLEHMGLIAAFVMVAMLAESHNRSDHKG